MFHGETHYTKLNRASRYVPHVLSRAAGAPGKSVVWEVKKPWAERKTPPLQTAVGKAVGHEAHAGIMILALATRHRVERPAISMEGGTVLFLWSGPARRRLALPLKNS